VRVGQQVRRRGHTEIGVVIDVLGGGFVSVSMPNGTSELRREDLDPVNPSPLDLLRKGELGDSELHLGRIRALLLQHAYQYDESAALSSARVEPAAHQVFVAHRVVNKLQPRMILADEVGLGKTIEAGLILKELRTRGGLQRVLIVTPASLLTQWRTELSSKFNEEFTILDGDALKVLGKNGRNPWASVDNVIASINLITSPKHADNLVEAGWDLVVFDEAHRVRRTFRGGESSANLAYRLADDLKNSVDGLLLLTATPVQLHQFELFSLIELVEPGRFADYRDFERMRLQLPGLNELMLGLRNWPSLTDDQRLSVSAAYDQLMSSPAPAGDFDDDQKRDDLLDLVSEQHPLANVMVRNRKAQLDMVSKRVAHRVLVSMTDAERAMYDEVSEYILTGWNAARASKNNAAGFLMVTYQRMLTSSSTAMRRSLERRAAALEKSLAATGGPRRGAAADLDALAEAEDGTYAAEQLEAISVESLGVRAEIEEIRRLAAGLKQLTDGKAGALLEVLHSVLSESPDGKFVIFTQFRDTQAYLRYAIEQNGWKVETFHGGMTPLEKEDAVSRFRDSAQVFLSTEAGGEGRNLQFCHYLVNYDLPWNPMKVEQRIGRLDRFGQRKPVIIYNLAYEQTLEERILDVLDQRIGIFTESVGALDPILGEVERDIQKMVMADRSVAAEGLVEYGNAIEQRVAQARQAERALADFAMDRSSLRRDIANSLLERSPLASPEDLRSFLEEGLERLGGSINDYPDGGVQAVVAPKLASSMRLSANAYRGSFDPLEALRMEQYGFFAVGHELVDKLLTAMRDVQDAETGARMAADVPAGTWVECVYRVRKAGPRPKAALVRHLVGPNLDVQESEISAAALRGRPVEVLSPDWVSDAVEASTVAWQASRQRLYDEYARAFEQDRVEQEARVRRLARHREARDRDTIEQLEQWLTEKEGSASAKDKKIMPANRARLTKARERLSRAQADLERDLAAVSLAAPDITFDLLWAGLVVGSER
jgi:ERCC4-related helicase